MPGGSASLAYREEEELEAADDVAVVTEDGVEDEGVIEPSVADALQQLIDTPNIVPTLTETELATISQTVIQDYDTDKSSRKEWEERTEAAQKLAMMVAEKKDYPFVGASNVKYPLVAEAALQFNALAYSEIVQNDRVGKARPNGKDPQGIKAARAARVGEHLSWQLLSEMPEWEPDTDRLTTIVAIVGSIFRKTFYDPALGRKCSRLVHANRFVINYWARSIEDAPRFTEELPLYPRDIQERILDGRFAAFDYTGTPSAHPSEQDKNPPTDNSDEDAPHLFLEQHRLLDLDGDGYREPYIVTVHKDSGAVCRIVANYTLDTVRMTEDGRVAAIRPQTFFTHYYFLPNPDGGFYGMGFGWLLKDTNEAINSTLNQLFDAGHLNNIQGGFYNAASGMRAKEIKIRHGVFVPINTGGMPMNQAILPFNYQPPSEALFKLLGLLIDYGKGLASIKDILTGDTGGKIMQPTTVMALIDQGMKRFNAIFKRIYGALTNELVIHCRLNRENLTAEQYNAFFDDPEQQFDPQADYDEVGQDITPAADPNIATKMQALTQAQLLWETGNGDSLVNQIELRKRFYEAAQIPDIDKLLAPPPQPDPAEQAFVEAMKKLSLQELVAKIGRLNTQQLKDIADAEAAELGPQLTLYEQFIRSMEMEANAGAEAGAGRVPGMAGEPDYGAAVQGPPGGLGAAPPESVGQPSGPVAGQPAGVGIPPV